MNKYINRCLSAILCSIVLASCGQSVAGNSKESLSLSDYLCAIMPVSCNSDLYKRVYLAPPDATYEITLNGKRLVVPMGYLDTTQLLSDPRYPVKTSLHLEMLLPDLAPHSPQNIREFFTPYERSKLWITVGIPSPGAMSWEDASNVRIERAKRESNSLIRRPNKFGLEGWGEDFDKWPRRRPCANLGRDEPPCTGAYPRDIWHPIKPNGLPSVMICDPDVLEDLDVRIVAMPEDEREVYFADPKQWSGRRRAMCSHDLFYERINAWVELRYPRRFIVQWKEIEDGVRYLLDTFIARGESSR